MSRSCSCSARSPCSAPLSALWTIGPQERTLRWAGVTLGYAARASRRPRWLRGTRRTADARRRARGDRRGQRGARARRDGAPRGAVRAADRRRLAPGGPARVPARAGAAHGLRAARLRGGDCVRAAVALRVAGAAGVAAHRGRPGARPEPHRAGARPARRRAARVPRDAATEPSSRSGAAVAIAVGGVRLRARATGRRAGSCTGARTPGAPRSRRSSTGRCTAPAPTRSSPAARATRTARRSSSPTTCRWSSRRSSASRASCSRWRCTRRRRVSPGRRAYARRRGSSHRPQSRSCSRTFSTGPGTWRDSAPSGRWRAAPWQGRAARPAKSHERFAFTTRLQGDS